MTIRIINGTFGWKNGSKVVPLNKDSGDIDLPKALEKRLVEVEKIAEYVEAKKEAPAKAPKKEEATVVELGDRKVEELDYKELQALYKQLELGSPVSVKKDDLIDAINEALGFKGEIEEEEVGEQNGDNLVPGEDTTDEEDEEEGEDETESDDDEDEDAPNLKNVDGVVK